MPFIIERNDITKMQVDAIVNATDIHLSGRGGSDRAIHMAAGMKLTARCRKIAPCEIGEAIVTRGYELPCRYIFHTVGPVWNGGFTEESKILQRCYQRCLELAAKYKCSSIAFPLISSGTFGYPKEEALKIAVDTIEAFLAQHEMTVYLIVYDKSAYSISKTLYQSVQAYIDDTYVETMLHDEENAFFSAEPSIRCEAQAPLVFADVRPAAKAMPFNIKDMENALAKLDESYSLMLMRKIDERGMKDAECYKKANIDRKLFSKIRSNPDYRPSKPTVLAFAFALELVLPQTQDLLGRAGFSLSHASRFDVIVECFLRSGNYDLFALNSVLFHYDQPLLGA